ncbi:MAG: amino acid--tRNA ligase-related protein, partial [Candidatus Sifarchaeia archaeon]
PKNSNPEISESFDLMYDWIELASGGTRVHKKEILIQRLINQGLTPSSFEFHLKVFDWGMPPHAGWGLGLARLVMVLTGRQNIREAVIFPRDRTRLTP